MSAGCRWSIRSVSSPWARAASLSSWAGELPAGRAGLGCWTTHERGYFEGTACVSHRPGSDTMCGQIVDQAHRKFLNAGWDDGTRDTGLGYYWLLNVPPPFRWDRGTKTLWPPPVCTDMDKLTVISGCLFLAADIFAIASIVNPDWISTGDSAGRLLLAPEKVEFLLVYGH